MTYQEALDRLDNPRRKDRKKIANNTYLIRYDDHIGIRLHSTDIIKLYPEYMQLFTRDWRTRTTKDRINAYINNAFIRQVSYEWYFNDQRRDIHTFTEGMKISYNGLLFEQSDTKTGTTISSSDIQKLIDQWG